MKVEEYPSQLSAYLGYYGLGSLSLGPLSPIDVASSHILSFWANRAAAYSKA
jgi:hypothetical protein